MPFSLSSPTRKAAIVSRPIEFQALNPTAIVPPVGATRMSYVLCGGGGGGASGGTGDRCGGGGGNCADTIFGDIDLAELAELIFGPYQPNQVASLIASIAFLPTIGTGGTGGGVQATPDSNGNSGQSGQDSRLIAKTNLTGNPTEVVIAVANGGTPGMGGTLLEGWCRDDRARTYNQFGGRGITSIKNEARSLRGSPLFTQINQYGNGGHGGDRGQPGLGGAIGYCSIAFY
jgi:hypothetical protein